MLEIGSLGSILFTLDGKTIDKKPPYQVQAAVFYLLCEKKFVPRDKLVAILLEPKTPDEQRKATNLFRQLRHRLRGTEFDEYIKDKGLDTDLSMVFDLNAPHIFDKDVLEMYLAVSEKQVDITSSLNAANLERGLSLYRGKFLHDFYLDNNIEFNDWVQRTRERLHHRVIIALKKLVNYCIAQKQYAAAITHCWRLLDMTPLDEEAVRALMWMLTITGQREAALKYYKDFERIVVRENEDEKAEPELATSNLYDRISAGRIAKLDEVKLTTVPIANVPAFRTLSVSELELRTKLLRSVSIFAKATTTFLVELAPRLKEEKLEAGQLLFEKGQPGQAMYIVKSGKLKAHDKSSFLNFLEPGSVFGEMAVLNKTTRMASITAVEDSVLLRLEQETLYDIIFSQPEIMLGIISVISQRLQDRANDLNKLRQQLQEDSNTSDDEEPEPGV